MRHVLFVDDDQDLLEATRDVLQYSGLANCVVATSLEELTRQRERALDCALAILDVNLGRGVPNGMDVLEWLRRERFGGSIVFLTGHAADHPLVAAATRLGACRVFTKPIELAELARLVEETDTGTDASRRA
jgi:DNA-binding NtrC family response regulator